MIVDHETLRAGDVISYQGVAITVLRAGELGQDLFGRPITRYWCRADEDPTREGFMSYGPGGVVDLVERADEPCPECTEPMAAVYVGADGVGVCTTCREENR
jgi:hypothetical protein